MYTLLRRMYHQGKLSDAQLKMAFEQKKWITKEEYEEIIASKPKSVEQPK